MNPRRRRQQKTLKRELRNGSDRGVEVVEQEIVVEEVPVVQAVQQPEPVVLETEQKQEEHKESEEGVELDIIVGEESEEGVELDAVVGEEVSLEDEVS